MQPLERFTIPNRYDLAPYGTLCIIKNEDGSTELYVQKSSQPDVAEWERVGIMLEKLFHTHLYKKNFLFAILDIYHHKKPCIDTLLTSLAAKNPEEL